MVGRAWSHARGVVSLDEPLIMGIVNLTPDSFSDGGRLWSGGVAIDAAVAYAHVLAEEGAAILDLGGESTRPGSVPVSVSEELARVIPVVAALAPSTVPISVDTRHAEVARQALAAGAAIINDVSGLADETMAQVVAQAGAGLVLGHLRGSPQTMQDHVLFADLRAEIGAELRESVGRAVAAGVSRSAVLVDPGVGFGKTAEQSAALVGSAMWLERATGCPVLIGASRKRFLGVLTGEDQDPDDRALASCVAAVLAVQHGAAAVRVHDVASTRRALSVARGIVDNVAKYGGGA